MSSTHQHNNGKCHIVSTLQPKQNKCNENFINATNIINIINFSSYIQKEILNDFSGIFITVNDTPKESQSFVLAVLATLLPKLLIR